MIDDKDLLGKIEKELNEISYPKGATALYRPISYTFEGGGKRLRPLLTLATCQALGGDPMQAVNQAVGIEMFHNFTLIHDDVMDRSPRRRGRPTVYRRWGDVQAILSGDALLTLATQRVVTGAGDKTAEVLRLFNDTALDIYLGQQLDTDFETRKKVSLKLYMEMIRLKTSVLLGAAAAMGAIMAGADDDAVKAMYSYGEQLGIAFQLKDDYLDIYGETMKFGKLIGNDILTRKKTWFYINANEATPARLEEAYNSSRNNREMIARVTKVFDTNGLPVKCTALIKEFADRAVDALPAQMAEADRDWFKNLALSLSSRSK